MRKNYHAALLAVAVSAVLPAIHAAGLETEFQNPPGAARPGVYWYFMDGNQDRGEMIADLRAMNDVGIGSVIFLEVDLGIPRGPVPFMSAQWQDNVADAFVEAGNLGMEVILGTGPGWSGSGGSWVGVDDSMQHLVGSSLQVSGPGNFNQVLSVPPPHSPNPYAGMNWTHDAQRNAWFNDVAVIAFPTPAGGMAGIDEVDIKTLKDVLPYSIRHANQLFVRPRASYPEPAPSQVIAHGESVDLTSRLQPDGRIQWTIPPGNWTIMRFVARNTGQTTRPAPQSGHGFECNKFDAASYRRHWENYQKVLLDKVVAKSGPLQPGRGLTTIHLDSWEMSSQNWTATFRQEFQSRRGYDPQPFYPTWLGQVVGSREKTERFLWDMRKTSQELVLENHAGEIKRLANQQGLLYSNQPYDMNPAGNIDLGSVADIPSCEFWNDEHDTQYGCIEAVSIAHTMGRQLVRAEAFTAGASEAFTKNPANMKNQTDWAFAMGINGIIFHTYLHQPLGPTAKPGMTLGPHGIHWGRNQPFWDMLPDYHRYIARASHMLRQGEAVADILYLTPEGAPHIFEAPADATEGPTKMRDKKGYSFDAVSARILTMRAVVENGRIAFPGGSKYRVLVLPDVPTMTPETLAKIDQLVRAGATVIGKPPVKSPSLTNHPACDTAVSTLAGTLWGGTLPPAGVTRIDRGSGAIYWGGDLSPVGDALYPGYSATAALLSGLGLNQDFTTPSGKLRFFHRRTADRDVYFVSNRSDERVVTEGVFRIDGRQPQLWDPTTGETRTLEDYSHASGLTRVPLCFEPLQSFFVVFPQNPAASTPPATPTANFALLNRVTQLGGAWDVAFDPAMGGPAAITFAQLVDWSQRPEEGIRYYSGKATYRKTFDLPGFDPAGQNGLHLDLGTVHGVCRVRLNGQNLGTVWTAPWRVDLTPALQSTGNQLEIELANNWVNRLIGDHQAANKNVRTLSWPTGLLGGGGHSAGRYTFATWNFYDAASPLRPAGLVGPVTILSTGPDIYPPSSSNLRPANGASTLFIPSTLSVTFDEPVIASTGNITIRNLTDGSQRQINITDVSQVTFSGNLLTLTPADALLPDKHYAIRISTDAVTDLAGNRYAGISDDISWNFTTNSSHTRVIVQDSFAGAFASGNGAMTGRIPDTVNLPGNAYTEQQNANVLARMELDTATGNPDNSLKTGFNNSAHIRYSHDGLPTAPVTLAIDIQLHTIVDDTAPRGIGLGFWNPLPTLYPGAEPYATTSFTGILVNPSGTLEYVRAGVSQGVFTAAPAGFSTSAFLNLTYTVDPATRKITQLIFAGADHTADFLASFPANFTPSDTAGFLGSTATNANFFGRVDNFIVALSQATGQTSSEIYFQGFEKINIGGPDVLNAGAAGFFTSGSWPTAPEFQFSGTLNLLKPAAGSAWLDPLPAALGTTFAVLHSGITATANPSETFADNTTYSLTFKHFRRDDLDGSALTVKILTASGIELASETMPAVTARDTYESRTLSYTTAGGPEVGQAIRLQLIAPAGGTTSNQTAIDNISLVVTPRPTGDNTFANWISRFNLGSQTGFTDDPDGDGNPNAIEAWFGTHPNESNPSITGLVTVGNTTTFTHPQNENTPSDLSGSYQWSQNLSDWYIGNGVDGPPAGPTVTLSPQPAGAITTVTATTSGLIKTLFLRIGVVQR